MGSVATANVFLAIAEPNRRRMLDLLRGGELAVQDLVAQFDMSFAAVSQHLAVLRRAGLVDRRADGRRRLYRATPQALSAVHDWTGRYAEFWDDRLGRLGAHLDENPS